MAEGDCRKVGASVGAVAFQWSIVGYLAWCASRAQGRSSVGICLGLAIITLLIFHAYVTGPRIWLYRDYSLIRPRGWPFGAEIRLDRSAIITWRLVRAVRSDGKPWDLLAIEHHDGSLVRSEILSVVAFRAADRQVVSAWAESANTSPTSLRG